jgi:hypothetical protein
VQLVRDQLGRTTNDCRLVFVHGQLARDLAPVLGFVGVDHFVAERRVAADPMTVFYASETAAHRAPVNLAPLVCGDQNADARQEPIVGAGIDAIEREDAHRHVLGELEPLLLVAREAIKRVGDDDLDLARHDCCAELVELRPRGLRA